MITRNNGSDEDDYSFGWEQFCSLMEIAAIIGLFAWVAWELAKH